MRAVLLLTLGLAAACGGDSTGPEPVPSMTGTWYFSDSLNGSMVVYGDSVSSATTCHRHGRWDIVDTLGVLRGHFYGMLRCSNAAGVLDSIGEFGELAGSRTGTELALEAGHCAFQGVFDPGAEAASGAVTCSTGFRWYLDMVGEWRGSIYHYPTCDSPDCVWTAREAMP
ncbi:MAG TPA: hypothetical protein VFV65_08020 [Gemmatimonadales bacterium]|nr:hypothetical protein [Gemmatimonadales bacterium]